MSSREQFEAWASTQGDLHVRYLPKVGCYSNSDTELAWNGWQAREELPAADFHDWLESAKPLVGYESHIADGNFDHADVIRLMEIAYKAGNK